MSWAVPGYTRIRELGSGAGGRVVLARHEESGTAVAIRYLGEELRADGEFLAGLRAEARLLGDLGSPDVVRLWEYVESAEEPAGAAIVMELVDGVPLRALLSAAGATGPEAALALLKGSLRGLAAAHAAGVVHRDHKPENVLVAADGSAKLGGFGVATAHGGTGQPVGTPPYMAPERWTGEPAAPPADVYAATATFFECLTGSRPYAATSTAELMVQHTMAPVPDEQAPEALRPLIRRGLAKDPLDRPAGAAEFLEEVEEAARAGYGTGWEATGRRQLAALAAPLLSASRAEGGARGRTEPAAAVPDGPPPRRPRLRRPTGGVLAGAALAGALVLLVGGYAAAALRSQTTADHAAVAAPTGYASTGVTPIGPPAPPGTARPSTAASATAHRPAAPVWTAPTAAAPSTAPTGSATAAPPAVHVTDLAIEAFDVDHSTFTGTLYADVTTDGTSPVRLTAHWFTSLDGLTDTVVHTETVTVSGRRGYVRVPFTPYTFPRGDCGEYLGVTLSSAPAAASGNPSRSALVSCPLP